jgi:DNA polymerase III subunit epsilon
MTGDPEAEVTWLRREVYGHEAEVPVHPITARERFSDRTWEFE